MKFCTKSWHSSTVVLYTNAIRHLFSYAIYGSPSVNCLSNWPLMPEIRDVSSKLVRAVVAGSF